MGVLMSSEEKYKANKETDLVISVSKVPEIIVITQEGKFYVEGRLVSTDKEVFDAFVRFLTVSGEYKTKKEETK